MGQLVNSEHCVLPGVDVVPHKRPMGALTDYWKILGASRCDLALAAHARAHSLSALAVWTTSRVEVIARDKKLRTKPVEIQALWDHGVRVFNIGGKDLATWEWLARAVRHRPRTGELIVQRGHGPWIQMLNENGVNGFVPKWLAGHGQQGPTRYDAQLYWPLLPIFRLLETDQIGRNYRNRHEILDGLDGI